MPGRAPRREIGRRRAPGRTPRGLSSGARGPPFKWILSSLNGACGVSLDDARQLARRGIGLGFQRHLEVDARVGELARTAQFQIQPVEVAVERVLLRCTRASPAPPQPGRAR